MITENKKYTISPKELLKDFPRSIDEYSNDEKCLIISDVADTFMNSQNETDLIHAESILLYATRHFFDVCDNNSKAAIYYRLAKLYDLHRHEYIKAYTAYKKFELNNTVYDGVHSALLRIILLRDDFTYSDELETELRRSYGEVDLGLKNSRIYENIGALLCARHDGDTQLCEKLTKRIKAIVKADELFFLDIFFKKDAVPDRLEAPETLLEFVKSL